MACFTFLNLEHIEALNAGVALVSTFHLVLVARWASDKHGVCINYYSLPSVLNLKGFIDDKVKYPCNMIIT